MLLYIILDVVVSVAHSRFKYVGTKYSVAYDVSNRGGKYAKVIP
jgi:hypothetical protein